LLRLWAALIQQFCIDSDLLGIYRPYCWRRGFLSMFKMTRGMLAAEEFAGHDTQGTTIYHYHRQPLLGLVIASVLAGTPEYDQIETYLQFAPARLWKWTPAEDEPSLAEAVSQAVEATFKSKELAFCNIPDAIHLLNQIQHNDNFATTTPNDVPTLEAYRVWIAAQVDQDIPGAAYI
jgi:hypothetical protein